MIHPVGEVTLQQAEWLKNSSNLNWPNEFIKLSHLLRQLKLYHRLSSESSDFTVSHAEIKTFFSVQIKDVVGLK